MCPHTLTPAHACTRYTPAALLLPPPLPARAHLTAARTVIDTLVTTSLRGTSSPASSSPSPCASPPPCRCARTRGAGPGVGPRLPASPACLAGLSAG
jgi:hypothetical protein